MGTAGLNSKCRFLVTFWCLGGIGKGDGVS